MSTDHIEEDGMHVLGLYPHEIKTIIDVINYKWADMPINQNELLILEYCQDIYAEWCNNEKKADQEG